MKGCPAAKTHMLCTHAQGAMVRALAWGECRPSCSWLHVRPCTF